MQGLLKLLCTKYGFILGHESFLWYFYVPTESSMKSKNRGHHKNVFVYVFKIIFGNFISSLHKGL